VCFCVFLCSRTHALRISDSPIVRKIRVFESEAKLKKQNELNKKKGRIHTLPIYSSFLNYSIFPEMMTSESAATTSITVSAPGKVLMCGGYLILDQAHEGMVFPTSSRIFVTATTASMLHDRDEPAQVGKGDLLLDFNNFLGFF
jgi:hypothetical protein